MIRSGCRRGSCSRARNDSNNGPRSLRIASPTRSFKGCDARKCEAAKEKRLTSSITAKMACPDRGSCCVVEGTEVPMHTHGDSNGGGGDRLGLHIGLPILPTAPAKEHKRGSRSGSRGDRGAADGVYPGHATREMRTGCGRNSNKIDMGMGCMIIKVGFTVGETATKLTWAWGV